MTIYALFNHDTKQELTVSEEGLQPEISAGTVEIMYTEELD